jgi:hypothetical protein
VLEEAVVAVKAGHNPSAGNDAIESALAAPLPLLQDAPLAPAGFRDPDRDLVSRACAGDRASEVASFDAAPEDARFAASVAAFGGFLRGGKYTGKFGYDDVSKIGQAAKGVDPFGYRSEFLGLVRAAKTASGMRPLK